MKKSRQRNWHEAKNKGFPPYRATNDTWTDNLKTDVSMRRRRSVKSYYFIIGEDANCAKRSEDVFCNGPLVAGSNYKVRAFVCTNGGCTYTPHFGPFVTRAVEPAPVSTTAAVAGGVVGAVEHMVLSQRRYYEKTRTENRASSDYAELNVKTADGSSENEDIQNRNVRPLPARPTNSVIYQNEGFEGSPENSNPEVVECQYEEIGSSGVNSAQNISPRDNLSQAEGEISDMKKYLAELMTENEKIKEDKKKQKMMKNIEKEKAHMQKEIQKLEVKLNKKKSKLVL
ncbi:hypothetical protein ScPMuIL_006177 [Solemya velum]